MLKTYLPWSKDVLRQSIELQNKGYLSALDLELTAKCSMANCIYCDSKPIVGKKMKGELSIKELHKLITDASNLKCQWIYTCGLGEPLEDDNFWSLLEMAHKKNINISLFTNALLINKDNAKILKKHNVSLIVKLDTLNKTQFDKILNKQGAAEKIYNSIEYLLAAGYSDCKNDKYTDLAISIVPSKLNIDDIDNVIDFAMKNNIFPSIGELEQAGAILDSKSFRNLSLTNLEVHNLRLKLDSLSEQCYTRPFCPAIITGVHIDVKGNCIVDNKTGLNCKWFLLEEPDSISLGNIKYESLSNLLEKVKNYRKKCFNQNHEFINEISKMQFEFGGCGGSPHEVIRIAKENLEL